MFPSSVGSRRKRSTAFCGVSVVVFGLLDGTEEVVAMVVVGLFREGFAISKQHCDLIHIDWE